MTLEELAKEIGCSKSTLDRALNNRGKVSQQMMERILFYVDKFNFRVNRAGKVLAMQNKLKFGIILSADLTPKSNSLFELIHEGMKSGAKELSNIGASFYFIKLSSGSAKEQVEAIQSLADKGVAAIAISIEEKSEELLKAIRNAKEQGIQFISYMNSIGAAIAKECFEYIIGTDQLKEGYIAAELMGRFLSGKGKVILYSGLMKNMFHQNRIDSAYEKLKNNYPDIEIIDVFRNAYPDSKVAEHFSGILDEHRDLSGVIISCGSNYVITDILKERGMIGQVKQIMFDATSKVEEELKAGNIDVVIGADLRKLGFNTIIALCDSIMYGRIESLKIDVPISIIFKECY
jgi:LacI family transcriptional regulator